MSDEKADEKADAHLDDDLHHGGGCCNACAFSALPVAAGVLVDDVSPSANRPVDGRARLSLVVENRKTGSVVVDLGSVVAAGGVGVVGFGRARDSAVFIDDHKISRRHGSFVFDESGVSIVDHGSGCGTFVNGKRVTRARLNEGDCIYLGDTVLRLLPG